MKKNIGKTVLGLLLLKTAFVAGWYVYEKYVAEQNDEKKPDEPKHSPKENMSAQNNTTNRNSGNSATVTNKVSPVTEKNVKPSSSAKASALAAAHDLRKSGLIDKKTIHEFEVMTSSKKRVAKKAVAKKSPVAAKKSRPSKKSAQ